MNRGEEGKRDEGNAADPCRCIEVTWFSERGHPHPLHARLRPKLWAAQLGELHIQSPDLNVVLGLGGLLDRVKSSAWVTGRLNAGDEGCARVARL